ncbi:formin homology 2 domain-containing protein [Ditylenchus destructor]|nr:formin homology 2 domain-containing protein [Ditylenchus destructor]
MIDAQNENLLQSIINDPQRSFSRFLFEADVLSTIELLNELVAYKGKSELDKPISNGYTVALECLWCWQDLTDGAFGLSPVVDELRQTDCVEIASAAIELVVNLVKLAPNQISRFRIRRELNGTIFVFLIKSPMPILQSYALMTWFKLEKFAWSSELTKLTDEWMVANTSGNCVSTATVDVVRTDADSGTFSSEDDEEETESGTMTDTLASSSQNGDRQQTDHIRTNDDTLSNLVDCLRSEKFNAHTELICTFLLELLKEVAAAETKIISSLPELLEQIRPFIHPISSTKTNDNATTSATPPKAPPPPPPPCLTPRNPPPAPSAPPPPINGLLNRERSKEPLRPHSKNGQTKSAADNEIPIALRPKKVPPEGKKMRHFQWTKIPVNSIIDQSTRPGSAKSGNIWQRMSEVDLSLKDRLDFSELEISFCNDPPPENSSFLKSANGSNSAQHSPSSSNQSKQTSVTLISAKRNLSVNVFLKMYKEVEKLIENLDKGEAELIGLDSLKMLLQLLPTDEEQQTLRHYTGDRNVLGQAERFLIELIGIPNYKLRIECMTFQQEFDSFKTEIEPDLDTLISACKELKASRCLQKILYVLLHMGNYLNYGADNLCNAVGKFRFKLNSLWKIYDVRAIRGNGRTLLHFIAQQVENCWEELEKELAHIPESAKLSFETIQGDLVGFQKRIQLLDNNSSKQQDDFFRQFRDFIENSKSQLSNSLDKLKLIERLRSELAAYFCENEKSFSMEECFKIFNAFINRFKIASIENNQRAEIASRKAEDTKLLLPTSTPDPAKMKSLNNFLLASSSDTPLSKRPRHSISSSNPLRVEPSSPTPRHSVVLEQDRGRDLQHAHMGTIRRRSSSALRQGLPLNQDRRTIFGPSIKEDEMEGDKPIPNGSNCLESFVETALNNNSKTRRHITTLPNVRLGESQEVCQQDEGSLQDNYREQHSQTPRTSASDGVQEPTENRAILNIKITGDPKPSNGDEMRSTVKCTNVKTENNAKLKLRPNSTIVLPSIKDRKKPPPTTTPPVDSTPKTSNGVRRAPSQKLPSIRARRVDNVDEKSSQMTEKANIKPLKPSEIKQIQKQVDNSNLSPPSSPSSTLPPKGISRFGVTLRKQGSPESSSNNKDVFNVSSGVKKNKTEQEPNLLKTATRNSQKKNREEVFKRLHASKSTGAPRTSVPSSSKVTAEKLDLCLTRIVRGDEN